MPQASIEIEFSINFYEDKISDEVRDNRVEIMQFEMGLLNLMKRGQILMK